MRMTGGTATPKVTLSSGDKSSVSATLVSSVLGTWSYLYRLPRSEIDGADGPMRRDGMRSDGASDEGIR